MKLDVKALVIGTLVIVLAVGVTSWWMSSHHKVWYLDSNTESATRDQYLAAKRLLSRNGYRVQSAMVLENLNLDQLPAGTMILGGHDGVMTGTQGKQLLAWASRGNTIVFQPRTATQTEMKLHEVGKAAPEVVSTEAEPASADDDDETDAASEESAAHDEAAEPEPSVSEAEQAPGNETGEDAAEAAASGPDTEAAEADEEESDTQDGFDPLSLATGARWTHDTIPDDCSNLTTRVKPLAPYGTCPPNTMASVQIRSVALPGRAPMLLNIGNGRVLQYDEGPQLAWQDNQGSAVRAYSYGKGRIVVAPARLFRNDVLREQDHGAFLLGLASLNGAHKHILLVEERAFLSWRELLWKNYKLLLISLSALLALLFWAAVRRFGPVLPDAAPSRRALMEHIEASGAWLWKATGGRQILLQAARTDLHNTLQRRAPGLLRQGQNSQHEELARLCGLPVQHVANAMHDDAATLHAEFTRQIRTLQTLRKHYER